MSADLVVCKLIVFGEDNTSTFIAAWTGHDSGTMEEHLVQLIFPFRSK